MRWSQWVLMVLGWGSAAIVLCALVVRRSINDPCPKLSIKCWIASLISIAYGVAWYFLMGPYNVFVSYDYFVSVIMAAVLGTALARILCPKLLDK
jgi:hypothetical protein